MTTVEIKTHIGHYVQQAGPVLWMGRPGRGPGPRGHGGPALGGCKRPLLRSEGGRGREGGGVKKGEKESKGRSKGASSSKIPLKYHGAPGAARKP